MKKLALLLVLFLLVSPYVFAQEMVLDPDKYVNAQIAADTLPDGSQAHKVYKVESGKFYAFDGSLEVDFDLVIEGPYKGWIMNDPNPPVFLQTPGADGKARDMFNLRAGGSIVLKNILLSGLHVNDVNISSFVRNYGGYKIVWDNCAFTDYVDHCSRTTAPTEEITITNCIFINGLRRSSSPFGGMPIRIDAACKKFTFENNTSVNMGREFGNGGNFFTSKMYELHNTFVNGQINAHELHWYEAIQANNIYYNWSWRGRMPNTNGYETYFTTWEYFTDVKEKLDSISLYHGFNAMYLDPRFLQFYKTEFADTLKQCLLWNADVDSTILADNNFRIGKNYWQFDPKFVAPPNNIDSMMAWLKFHWLKVGTFPDWRIELPVTYNAEGLPELHWPPKFNLKYTNDTLLTGGTDGLPLGDLNWFPEKKAIYLANRDKYIAALQDSIAKAKYLYVPGDSASALITWKNYTSVESYGSSIPNEYYLSNNYPNPFNPTTKFEFGLPAQSKVTITIYNILGQKVFELKDKDLPAGVHTFNFNAYNLSSGVYIYNINAVGINGKNYIASKKMILTK